MRRSPVLVLVLVLVAGSSLPGCGGGYLHTHPHVCRDGMPRTHRHWHSEDGGDGHHPPEGGSPAFHREMAWGD